MRGVGLSWQRWHWAGTWEVQPTLRVSREQPGSGPGCWTTTVSPRVCWPHGSDPVQCTAGSARLQPPGPQKVALGMLSPTQVSPHGRTGTPDSSHPTVTGWKVQELGKAGGGRGPPPRPWTVIPLSTCASSHPRHSAEVRPVRSVLLGPSWGRSDRSGGNLEGAAPRRAPPTGRGEQCPPAGRSRDGVRTRAEVSARGWRRHQVGRKRLLGSVLGEPPGLVGCRPDVLRLGASPSPPPLICSPPTPGLSLPSSPGSPSGLF